MKTFAVFYRDYANEVVISSANAEPLAADRLMHLAERLLVHEDNFLGVQDTNDCILQCYLDGDRIIAEILYPESTGCLRSTMSKEQLMQLLDSLPASFDEKLLPGAKYINF